MKKRKDWKQKTPHAQLTVVAQSLWGHADNAAVSVEANQSNAIDLPVFVERMNAHAQEILDLLPFLVKGSW